MAQVTCVSPGGVNCYLVRADRGFVLIETGGPSKRAVLERELAKAGCWPGDLRVLLLTHGDYNHAGNAAYLRERYDIPVAMHAGDLGRVRRGDWNRGQNREPDRIAWSYRLFSFFTRKSDFDVFEPDTRLEDLQRGRRAEPGEATTTGCGHSLPGAWKALSPEGRQARQAVGVWCAGF